MTHVDFYKYVADYLQIKPAQAREFMKAVKMCLIHLLSTGKCVRIFQGCTFVSRFIPKHEYHSPNGTTGVIDDHYTYTVVLTDWFKKVLKMEQGVTDEMIKIDGKWCKKYPDKEEEEIYDTQLPEVQ